MYQRYAPRPGMRASNQGKPPSGEMGSYRQNIGPSQHRQSMEPPQRRQEGQQIRSQGYRGNNRPVGLQTPKPSPSAQPKKCGFALSKGPLLGLLPPSLYNPETKKILGFLSAEDLLLVALILLMLDSGCEEDSSLVYVLVYLLLSDYIDLPL